MMTLDEVIKRLSRGCCSRKQAADKQCDLCGPRYEAIDEVIRWHSATEDAQLYSREMGAHALESARKRYEAQVALVNVWGLLTGKPMEQPVSLGGGGYVDLNVPSIVDASNKAAEVAARAEAAEARVRELEAERDEARRSLDLSVRAWDTTGGPREGMLALIRRAEAAEAQLAALRIEMECLADSVARERLTHDGDLADIPGPGALARLGDAERLARDALTDTTATAEAYTRRVRAEALECVAKQWMDSVDGSVRTSDRERIHDWIVRRANEIRAEAERIEGGS